MARLDKPYGSVLELIGDTPVVELKRFDTGRCRLFVKLESQNPGGSIKDRIALSMIADAERYGRLAPGGTIVEATAGNTGLGLAQVGIPKGYRIILVVPDKMSREKIQHLRALGAEVRLTRSDVGKGHAEYYQDMAEALAAEIPGAFYVNQFANPANPAAARDDHRARDLVAARRTDRRGRRRRRLGRHPDRPRPLLRQGLAEHRDGARRSGRVGARTLGQDGRRWKRPGAGRSRASAKISCLPMPTFPWSRRPIRSPTSRACWPCATCSPAKAFSPVRPRARCSPPRCATAASRRRKSVWSPSSATAATSIFPRCSTISGWPSKACPKRKQHGDLRDLVARAHREGGTVFVGPDDTLADGLWPHAPRRPFAASCDRRRAAGRHRRRERHSRRCRGQL